MEYVRLLFYIISLALQIAGAVLVIMKYWGKTEKASRNRLKNIGTR